MDTQDEINNPESKPWSFTGRAVRGYTHGTKGRIRIGHKMRQVWDEINSKAGVSLSALKLQHGHGVIGRLIEYNMIEIRQGVLDQLVYARHEWQELDRFRDLNRPMSDYAQAKDRLRHSTKVRTLACPECGSPIGKPCTNRRYDKPDVITAPCYPRLILWVDQLLHGSEIPKSSDLQ